MKLLVVSYPDSLPCPQRARVERVDPRQVSDQSYPREARSIWLDRLHTERVVFPPMNAAQFSAFREWWRDELVFGGSWFVASWPNIEAADTKVYRFLDAPVWSFVAGGFWQISAQVEIRGLGLDPIRPPETISLLHLDGSLLDAVGGSYQDIPDNLLPLPFVSSSAGFGQQGSFSYSLGGVGQSGITRVYAGSDPLIDTPEWQIDAFLTLTAGSFGARTLVTISRDTSTPVQTTLVSVQVGSGSTDLRTLVRTVGSGIVEIPEVSLDSRDLVDGQRTHVRVTYRNGEVLQFHDGVPVAQLSGVTVDTVVASTTSTRISVGCTPSGGTAGIPAFSAKMAGRIDEFRLATEVTDSGTFEVPDRPFTLPI